MGQDKASMQVEGEPIVRRIERLLAEVNIPSTILGPGGIEDDEAGAGPLAALASYQASRSWVFVISCDIPRFDARVVVLYSSLAEGFDAVIPNVHGRLQPLCALYRADALSQAKTLSELGERRVMTWVETLKANPVNLNEHSYDERCVQGANSPEEWQALT